MKYTAANILGLISLVIGMILAIATVLLLFSGQLKTASIFVIPAFALFTAGSNLRVYSKKSRNEKTA